MREINLDKNRCISGIVILGGFSIFCVILVIGADINDSTVPFGKKLMLTVLAIGFLFFLIKYFFEYLISFLRFYNLRIEILRDKLILRTDTKRMSKSRID